MSIVFAGKVFSGVINDNTATFYSDDAMSEILGTAERYLVQMKFTNVSGSDPKMTVMLQRSNDGVDWVSVATLFNTQSVSSGLVLFSNVLATTLVVGTFMRFSITFSPGSTMNAYVEMWATGRDAL